MGKYENKNRQAFLLTFFPEEDKYEVKEINGFVLIKYFSNATHLWEVQIYTPETYAIRQSYLAKQKAVNQQALLEGNGLYK